MHIGVLLDDGATRLAHLLVAAAMGLVLVLFIAIFVPVAVLVSVFHSPGSGAPIAVARWQVPSTVHTALPPAATGVVETARRYLGVRYLFGGSDPAVGLDCSGLVQLVYRELGVSLPRTAQLQYDATARVLRDQLQPGDLVFFARTYDDPHDWITHVGIYIGDGLQINAPTEGQVVSIQPVFSGFWGAHFAAGGRIDRPVAHLVSLTPARKEST